MEAVEEGGDFREEGRGLKSCHLFRPHIGFIAFEGVAVDGKSEDPKKNAWQSGKEYRAFKRMNLLAKEHEVLARPIMVRLWNMER